MGERPASPLECKTTSIHRLLCGFLAQMKKKNQKAQKIKEATLNLGFLESVRDGDVANAYWTALLCSLSFVGVSTKDDRIISLGRSVFSVGDLLAIVSVSVGLLSRRRQLDPSLHRLCLAWSSLSPSSTHLLSPPSLCRSVLPFSRTFSPSSLISVSLDWWTFYHMHALSYFNGLLGWDWWTFYHMHDLFFLCSNLNALFFLCRDEIDECFITFCSVFSLSRWNWWMFCRDEIDDSNLNAMWFLCSIGLFLCSNL